jgi:xylan 1,4-beta-xylosidase
MEFEPEDFKQAAGLVCYYNGGKFYYLQVSHEEGIGKHLRVVSCSPDSPQADSYTEAVKIPAGKRVELRVEVDFERLCFGYRVEGVHAEWQWVPQLFDASILSDEAAVPGTPNFTGAFVGVACQGLAGIARAADFDWFDYEERGFKEDGFGVGGGMGKG